MKTLIRLLACLLVAVASVAIGSPPAGAYLDDPTVENPEATLGSATCSNRDGRKEQFYIYRLTPTGTYSIARRWESFPGSGYGPAASLGGITNFSNGVACSRNQEGKLHVFTTGTDGEVYVKFQKSVGSSASYSTSWVPMSRFGSSNVVTPPGAIYAATGKMEIFAAVRIAPSDFALYTRWQLTPNGDWSGWHRIGGNIKPGTAITPSRLNGTSGGVRVEVTGVNGLQYCIDRRDAISHWGAWFRC